MYVRRNVDISKDESVQLGYLTSHRFYKLCSKKAKENKTYEQFCDSPYHNAFVFGPFVNNVQIFCILRSMLTML